MAEQEKRTVAALGLEQEEFEAWRTHPTTKKIHRLLRNLASNVRAQWEQGEAWTDDMKRYVMDLEDFAGLTFEEIEAFYSEEDDDGST